MSVTITPIVNADSFGTWLARTNQIATIISSNTVTVSNTLNGGNTYGNGTIIGQLGANIIFVIDGLRGGNLTSSNTLSVTTNTVFKYNTNNLVSVSSNTVSSNLDILVNTVKVTGNVIAANTITVPALFIDNMTANTVVNVGSNVSLTTSKLLVSNGVVNTTISSDGVFTNGSLSVTKSASFANSISALGNITSTTGSGSFAGTLFVGNAATISNTLTVTGQASIQNSVSIGQWANIAGNLRVGGDLVLIGNMAFSAQIAGDLNPTQTATYRLGNTTYRWDGNFSSINVSGSNSNFQSGLLYIDTTNNRIGINNTAPGSALTANGVIETNNSFKFPDGSIVTSLSNTTTGTALQAVDSFSLASYRSANYTVSVKDNIANGYQVSNMLVVHNGTTSYITEFGTMFTNASLGVFSSDANATHARLLFTPVSTSATLKIAKTALVV
jgi:hypothetical protein